MWMNYDPLPSDVSCCDRGSAPSPSDPWWPRPRTTTFEHAARRLQLFEALIGGMCEHCHCMQDAATLPTSLRS